MGRDQRNQNNLHVWASRRRRRRARRTHQPQDPRAPARSPLGASVLGPLASRASTRPLTLEAPSEEREADPATGTSARGYQAASSPSYHPTSVPKQPLTRMQAATTSTAVATRLFPALTSTRVDPHQLSFQSKPKSSSREPPPPPAPPRPSGSDAHAVRVQPPAHGELFRFLRALPPGHSPRVPRPRACATERD